MKIFREFLITLTRVISVLYNCVIFDANFTTLFTKTFINFSFQPNNTPLNLLKKIFLKFNFVRAFKETNRGYLTFVLDSLYAFFFCFGEILVVCFHIFSKFFLSEEITSNIFFPILIMLFSNEDLGTNCGYILYLFLMFIKNKHKSSLKKFYIKLLAILIKYFIYYIFKSRLIISTSSSKDSINLYLKYSQKNNILKNIVILISLFTDVTYILLFNYFFGFL